MIELLKESFSIPNLPATVLLIVVLLYWIINLIGIFDLDMLHADADGHIETDGHGDSDTFIGKTFDFGDVPVAIVVSFFVLFLWMTAVTGNYYLGNSSLWFALLIYIPCAIFSFVVTKAIAIPLNKVFKYLKSQSKEDLSGDFSGSVCVIMIEASSERMGQGEVNRNGDPIRVNIKTYPGKKLKKGESALLIEYLADKGFYIAEPYKTHQ